MLLPEKYYEYKELLGEKCSPVLDIYHKIVPYNWRPSQIWYRTKCFCWYRYTTIKPRTLNHQWCDRCELLPHMMFEILSEFIEKECSPGHVNWNATERDQSARKKMQEIYDWWHTEYLNDESVFNEWHEFIETHSKEPDTYLFHRVFDTPENAQKADELWKLCHNKSIKLEEQKIKYMKELCEISPYMWT